MAETLGYDWTDKKKQEFKDQYGIFPNQVRPGLSDQLSTPVREEKTLDLSIPPTPGTSFEGPKWKERLDSMLKNYSTLASHLPFPTANPILMKQRQTLQKRADGYSYLQSKSPRSIRWSDNFTNADMIKAWETQKDQFIGEAYAAAKPQNVAQTNALARSLQLGSEDWQDILKLHRASITSWEFKKNAMEFDEAWRSKYAERMIGPIIREIQLENASSVNDNGEITYDSMPPLMALSTIRDRLIDLAAAYNIPELTDPEIIKQATEMYTLSTPGIQFDTWYSPDGTVKWSVDKRDRMQQEKMKDKKWSTSAPTAETTAQLGMQSLALPTAIMVGDEFGKDSDTLKEYKSALKYFELPKDFRVGSVRELTIETSKDLDHVRALQKAGAMNYKAGGTVQEAVFVGPGGFEMTFQSNNPVMDRYYRGKAFKIGGEVHVKEGERAARIVRGEPAESRANKVRDRQAKARDLNRLATTMLTWQKANPQIFGLGGSIMHSIQTTTGVVADVWNMFTGATGIGKPATSGYQADNTAILITNTMADIRNDPDMSESDREESILYWTKMRDQLDAAKQVLNDPSKAASLFTDIFTGGPEASRQLAQIKIYELGMATQLARLWSTKDRLLKDIYTRATEAASMFTGSSEQVRNRIERMIKLSYEKMVDYEKELVPGLAKQKFTSGEYGHVIPFTDESFEKQMYERYPWMKDS